jgi:hypothetical protein
LFFQIIFLAGLSGLCSIKGTGPSPDKELEVVFRSYFGRPFRALQQKVPVYFQPNQELVVSDHILAGLFGLCSIKGAGPYFQPNQGLEVFFSDHILAGLFGLCSIKVPVLLSTEPRSWRLFSDHILAGLFGLCSIKGAGPTLSQTGLELFSDHILGLFGLCSIKGAGPTFNQNQSGCFSDHIWQAFSGSAALKVLVLLSTRQELGCFFRSYFGSLFGLCSIKGTRSTFQPDKGLELFFRSYFGRPFPGSAALKLPVLLSARPGAGGCFQIIFCRPFRALQH